ncbi:Crp/Fnr family transcriptional regulator [Simiduia sp. 21SJ11W-1]|uniref:Crp/Fnr family transcriptional regulator n=1 Tax=Simiduia sp. 21SJ11W-1 TaxID=2909669 RepID=UPI0020A13535|nr:Crp/Fnr family transcriptional regulator [Simiduia sp. 21SJ11W-1]UTA48933.1 Crp/Fnr family transcriptional regulator [Simiduia sp. 21SJ11W-1]
MEKLSYPIENLLICALSRRLTDHLIGQCRQVWLARGDLVYERNRPYRYIYFPLSGVYSFRAIADDHRSMSIETIGREGMLGVAALLGNGDARFQCVSLVSGKALRISVGNIRKILRNNSGFDRSVGRYIMHLMGELSQSIVCVQYHTVEQRLARWLIEVSDQCQGEALEFTHVSIARLMGVRRSGVSIAAHGFLAQSLISYTRGSLRILNRTGLMEKSCNCYIPVKH